jgi:hypothetical protein
MVFRYGLRGVSWITAVRVDVMISVALTQNFPFATAWNRG